MTRSPSLAAQPRNHVVFTAAFLLTVVVVPFSHAQRPRLLPPPVPIQNPITEPKRILGKILFWDEQLSSDNTVACGTCHIPAAGGVDPRLGTHPGIDGAFETPDDMFGSFGVVRMDTNQQPVEDPIFGFDEQVTPRTAPSFIMAAYAPFVFWDMRADVSLVDPVTQQLLIFSGATLEVQALDPPVSSVEMGHAGRTWVDVLAKLQASRPLALASNIPPDMANALAAAPTYAQLFQNAFGAPVLTAGRVAMALATYERTLIPDQAPWDRFNLGDATAMTPLQQAGATTFFGSASRCTQCHNSPRFTNNDHANIGLRPPEEDLGRFLITNAPMDRGRFKAPSLRNVGLRNRLTHKGHFRTVADMIDFYRNPDQQFADNQDPQIQFILIPAGAVSGLIAFLEEGLTDPRVANETFPFDRPRLRSELLDGDLNCDGVLGASDIGPFVLALTDTATYSAQFQACTPLAGDLNLDGDVTIGDIALFVAVLTQS